MKVIALSLSFFLLHLQIFLIPINYVYSYISFIHYDVFLVSISLSMVYFSLYKSERLSNLTLNNLIKSILILSTLLSFVCFIIPLNAYLHINYQRLLADLAFFFMTVGFLLLFIQNQPKTNNNLKLDAKFILILAIVFILAQLNLLEHLVAYTVAVSLHIFNIDTTLSSTFIIMEGLKYTLAFLLLGLFILFSNFFSRIIYQKHNTLILIAAIVFYLLWIIFTFHEFTIINTQSPYFNEKPYWFLQWTANILFFIVFIRVLFFSNAHNTFNK